MSHRFLSVLLIALLAVSVAAQAPKGGTTGGTPGGTTGGTTGGGNTGTTTPGNTPNPARQPNFGDQSNNPFSSGRGVSGKIMPQPGQRLQVELYMDGIRLDQTFSDMEGNFRFERQSSGRRYEIHIFLGDGQEYVEELEFQPNFPTMVYLRPGNIRNTRADAGKASGTVISLASLKVPKDARKEFDKGRDLGRQKKYEEGMAHLQKAVSIYASYAEAYNEMGLIFQRQSQMDDAEKMYRKAIEADSKWTYSYLNLAQAQLMRHEFKDCLETAQKALVLSSNMPEALFMQAYSQANLGKLEEAEKSALAADQAQATVPRLQWLLGKIYEVKGSPALAVERYKRYLKESPNAPDAEQVKQSIAKLDPK